MRNLQLGRVNNGPTSPQLDSGHGRHHNLLIYFLYRRTRPLLILVVYSSNMHIINLRRESLSAFCIHINHTNGLRVEKRVLIYHCTEMFGLRCTGMGVWVGVLIQFSLMAMSIVKLHPSYSSSCSSFSLSCMGIFPVLTRINVLRKNPAIRFKS